MFVSVKSNSSGMTAAMHVRFVEAPVQFSKQILKDVISGGSVTASPVNYHTRT